MKNPKKIIRNSMTAMFLIPILALFGSFIIGLANNALAEVRVGTNSRQTEKIVGAQESTHKTTSSLPGFVTGKVFDNVTGSGIPDAEIKLLQSGETVVSDRSAGDGMFFLRIAPGNYNIKVVKSGFENRNDTVEIDPFETELKNMNMAPSISSPPTPPDSNDPNLECAQGGAPSRVEILPSSLSVRPGGAKLVRIHVLKDKIGGCSIDVNIKCVAGCEKIELKEETVTTNKRGFAVASIGVKKLKRGIAVLRFEAGKVKDVLPVKIEKSSYRPVIDIDKPKLGKLLKKVNK